MPSMLDMIKANAVPSNLMHAAANGSLSVPPVEVLEILVHLTNNKVFGKQARLTLAAWDLDATQAAVRDPHLPKTILDYFINPQNIRPKLLPNLIENPAVTEDVLLILAVEGSRDVVRAMMASPRVRASHKILHPLSLNVNVTVQEAEQIRTWMSANELRVVGGTESGIEVGAGNSNETSNLEVSAATNQDRAEPGSPLPIELVSLDQIPAHEIEDHSEAALAVVQAFEREHAAELAAEAATPFKPLGGTYGLETEATNTDAAEALAPLAAAPVTTPASGGAAAAAPARIKPVPAIAPKESVLQKIARLGVHGRVQLAVRGSKEERAILIRDGTKLVALAVLLSPKISDGEVEKFAGQKNVLEATLRGIAMHRRFMKNYIIVRNLTSNPRTPLDLSLGLVKNLLPQDLKNLSGNKEVSETLRKMALRAFKQKDNTKKN